MLAFRKFAKVITRKFNRSLVGILLVLLLIVFTDRVIRITERAEKKWPDVRLWLLRFRPFAVFYFLYYLEYRFKKIFKVPSYDAKRLDVQGMLDILESDLKRATEKLSVILARNDAGRLKVELQQLKENIALRSRDEIHEEVYNHVKSL